MSQASALAFKELARKIKTFRKDVQEKVIEEFGPKLEKAATKNASKHVDSGATLASQRIETLDDGVVLSYGTRAAQYLVGGKGKARSHTNKVTGVTTEYSGKTRVFVPKSIRSLLRKAVKRALELVGESA